MPKKALWLIFALISTPRITIGSPLLQEKTAPMPKVSIQEVTTDLTRGKAIKLTLGAGSLTLADGASGGTFASDVLPAPFPFSSIGARWATRSTTLIIRVRGSRDRRTWTGWQPLEINDDLARPDKEGESLASLIYLGQGTRFIQYSVELRASSADLAPSLSGLVFVYIDPGDTPEQTLREIADRTAKQFSSAASQPHVISRNAWGCPDGEGSPLWSPQYTSVTHLIVHHTDTTNSASDWPAQVRSIWTYHTYTNGWGDIGYNYLIDPNGTIYEGRAGGDNVIGAHFSCKNGNTMGVGMLGTFSGLLPTANALASLENLLAWKSAQQSLDPLGISYHPGTALNLYTISGHRDGNPSPYVCGTTTCPGDTLYSYLPSIRTAVKQDIGGSNLSVSLSASSTSGNAPLSNVSLTATVTGSPQQTINYTFYCNRADTGTNITTPYDAKVDGTFTNPLTEQNLCTYTFPGTYYAKVIAEQGTGAAQSQVQVNVSQVPQTGPPTVTTGGADGISATGATVHGTVNPNGLDTNVYFGYSTDQVTYAYTGQQYMGKGTSAVQFAANLSGLACQTSYWYYAIAYNSAGGIGGYLQPFTTASCAPTPRPLVLSASVDGITQTIAVLHASVDPNGVPTNAYFLYDTTTNTGNSTPSTSLSGSGAQPVSIPISALSCGTTYYYRPIAYNINTGQGTTLDWQTFATNSCSASGTSFYTLTPCRILDTRLTGNPISANSGLRLPITGICGIPPTATAVALNVTAVGATSQGILSVYPEGSVPPNYTVAFGAGQTRAASTVVGLSSIGTLMAFCYMPSGQGQTDYILDVSGYFQ